MPQTLDGPALAVVRVDETRGTTMLLGTGTVLSSTLLITCAHVVQGAVDIKHLDDLSSQRVGVLCGDGILRPSRIRYSEAPDLCALYFAKLPVRKSAQLFRVARLEGTKLEAVGFEYEMAGPRQYTVRGIEGLQDQHHGERLQYAKLSGGPPSGFSGGPVLAKDADEWRIVGILQYGGEEAATSRMIAADPIAAFLAGEGVTFPIAELRASPQPPDEGDAQAIQTIEARDSEGIRIRAVNKSAGNAEQNVRVASVPHADIDLTNTSRRRR